MTYHPKNKDHCSFWLKRDMTDDQRTCIGVLCAGLGAIYNLPIKWSTADFSFSNAVVVNYGYHDLATFDFNKLTHLVFAAHDACVRVSIAPRGPNHLRIALHKRPGRTGDMSARHPTLEQAIADFRRLYSPVPADVKEAING